MQRLALILLVVAMCQFAQEKTYALTPAVIKIKVDNSNVPVGNVIHLIISVKAGKDARISWQTCTTLFSQSNQITLLGVDSMGGNGSFEYRVAFTSIKPALISVHSLPVIINGRSFFTSPFKVNFKADRPISKLNDIKPVENAHYGKLAIAMFETAMLLIAIILSLRVIYSKTANWLSRARFAAVRKDCLEKLANLESAAHNRAVPTGELVNTVAEILSEYLRKDADLLNANVFDTGNAHYNEYRDISNRLKFLPQSAAEPLYRDFLNNAREFIITYQPVTLV